MNKIKLDSRLMSVASLVRKGSVVADIGTDHAYVVAYLVQNGITKKAIASDLRKGPLKNAENTLIKCGIADDVEIVLSDGLQNISEGSCDDIIIAGMGGILISEILEKAPWIKNKDINIILQPMSHGEVLRKWLAENGFEIKKEIVSTDGKHLYTAFSAMYTGAVKEKSNAYCYIGELTKNNDDLSRNYIEKTLDSLEKKYSAQKNAGISDADGLKETIDEIKALIGRLE